MQAMKANLTRAFWRTYYPRLCQVVMNGEMVLPHGTVMKLIYERTFKKWWHTGQYRHPVTKEEFPAPSFSTFLKQSDHVSFGHVNKKAKHTQLRCLLCATLRTQSRRGFENDEDTEAFQRAYEQHGSDVVTWRDVEAHWKSKGQHEPFKYMVLMADDTESLGFPHFTRRNIKGVATIPRVHFVPWLFENFSTQEQVYVYSLKHKFKKGGNRSIAVLFCDTSNCSCLVCLNSRFCSMVQAITRATKERDCSAASAKELVFMGLGLPFCFSHLRDQATTMSKTRTTRILLWDR
jgi:hypothetical protein